MFFAQHKSKFLIRVIIPGRKNQCHRELKGAAQFCSKITDVLKKLKPSEEPKELSECENQDIATSDLRCDG